MTIAAHIIGSPSVLWESLNRLAITQPQNHFIFFIDTAGRQPADIPGNCTPVLISPKIKNSLLLHYWYNYKLPHQLKRYNADVFISENAVLSLNINTAQIMLVKNITGEKKTIPGQDKHARYLQKFFPAFLKKAMTILTTEKYLAEIIAEKYPFATGKIFPVYHGLNKNYQPQGWQQKEEIKTIHADEKDYFLFTVSANTKNNIIAVLKAFSHFKKWQKSNMQLLLLAQNKDAVAIKDFHLYKYRKEVKIITGSDNKEAAEIMAAAYALIYLPVKQSADQPCLEAMQCGIPVITADNILNKSMYDDAVIYTGTEEKIIAEKMMLLYKDENLRSNYIKKGLMQTAKYNWDNTAQLFWQAIIKMGEQ